ncbi:MAG TPA: hypothetical protein VF042_09390 [Gemmatimonadaceae bacterium]
MPSRARIRSTIETALRALSIAVLAWMFWLSLDRGRPEKEVAASTANLGSVLKDWSRAGIAPDQVSLRLEQNPAPAHRDWIRALAHSGSTVSWQGNLPVAAVSVGRIASPAGGLSVLTAAPPNDRVTISDELGTIEGANAAGGGARFNVPAATGEIVATVGGTRAHASMPDSLRVGRVLVIGSAGWETKFVTAALEEDGWKVDTDVHIAPSILVTQGATSSIDTARYSTVIALDASAASRAGEIARFVASGGGVVLAGGTGGLVAFASIRAGAAGKAPSQAEIVGEPGAITQASLAAVPIVGLRNDAIRVESRGSETISAARRHIAGRVLQTGYIDTWRWRMSGGDEAPAEHRQWWTRVVASVAYAPAVTHSVSTADNAPVADLVAALGPQSVQSKSVLASAAGSISMWLLFAILSLSLLGEWASRRLRGQR